MQTRNAGYENLVTVLAVAAVVALLGATWKMVNQHSVPFVASVKPIMGYVKPKPKQGEAPHTVPHVTGEHGLGGEQPVIRPEDYDKIKERFEQAVALLHAKRFEYAVTALNDILTLQNNMPEVYVNLGYAYLGLKDFASSQSAFEKAIDLRPNQSNAYWGLAVALEGSSDLEAALGAMRSYIHLSDPKDQHVIKARAAIWEWEQRLGRLHDTPPPLEGDGDSNITDAPATAPPASTPTSKPSVHSTP